MKNEKQAGGEAVLSSAGLGMRVEVRYIVTHPSADNAFQCGDRIRLCGDGAIENIDAQGWMDAKDVPLATRGMTVALDVAWLERHRKKLAAQMTTLHV